MLQTTSYFSFHKDLRYLQQQYTFSKCSLENCTLQVCNMRKYRSLHSSQMSVFGIKLIEL